MPDTSQREVVESVFERNQRREAEINNALKQEAARREDVIRNMHRLRALRLARDEKLRSTMSAFGGNGHWFWPHSCGPRTNPHPVARAGKFRF